MEQINANHLGSANFKARTVKDIIEPVKSISNKVSVKAALDEMQARAIDSSPVIDQRGELLGTLSKNKMNRNVGGLGHDPKTEPVEAHIEKNNAYCFEDQTIAEAEQLSDCTEEKMEKTLGLSEIPRLRAPQSAVRSRYSTTGNQQISQKLRAS
jgi:predicted transcriptional regulator